jgi:hypothetical protein
MNILYTDETLIQYYYGECELTETFEIEHVLENDVNHNNHYASIYNQIQEIKKSKKGPSVSALDKILAYSRA